MSHGKVVASCQNIEKALNDDIKKVMNIGKLKNLADAAADGVKNELRTYM